ncbi:hypothetical protein SAMN05421770_107213 [Granulicella rosea]|uniref:DUF1287 domain-containing protein n=1 Tax=Granulicella rosea TaxID=474952 RepID=A0A239LR77_9BACT|nr:DUF1287 domain-containing protein [Granulicella rosea]SNT32790.1 hypothetical protein SAMN05421770_107213 [Granulicella rosea]
MLRRTFLGGAAATLISATVQHDRSERLAQAARSQLGVTTGYDPSYIRIPYPLGDVPRSTGVCADVIVRAARDGLGLDLQRLVHEDMAANFSAYPRTWAMQHPDPNIDHRRVLNLETFWRRKGSALWSASAPTDGNAFPKPLEVGDIVTWLLDARLPHVAVVVAANGRDTRVVHNIGGGAQEIELAAFRTHRAKGHFRWPA